MSLNSEKKLRDEVFNFLMINNLAPISKSRSEINNATKRNYNIEIHKGERGVWRDSSRTKKITNDEIGVAVSFHSVTEGPYDDIHSLEFIKYAFPNTKSFTHDVREIESMKVAHENELPLFIVVGPKGGDKILRRGLIKSINYDEKYWIIEPLR